MLAIQATSSQPWISFWTGLSAASRRLAHHWADARLHRRTLEQLATLSDHQLRDLWLEESPYHDEGALRDACHLKARLAGRDIWQFLPAAGLQPRPW